MTHLTTQPGPITDIFENRVHTASSAIPVTGVNGTFAVQLDGDYTIPFAKSSDVYRQFQLGVDPLLLVDKFVGSKLHIVNDQVVDYRYKDYAGFVHSESNLVELSNRVGFFQDKAGKIIPRNTTSKFEHTAFDSAGGLFDVDGGFQWSAFSPNLESRFEMIRALCENQMIFGKGTVMARNVPIINSWESNMEVCNHVLKRIFETTVSARLASMPTERASMNDVKFLGNSIASALESDIVTHDQRKYLGNLKTLLDPVLSLPGVRTLNTNDLKRLASPVTLFDAFNVATEMATHYLPEQMSPVKLQGFMNSCVFDHKREANITSTNSAKFQETFASTDVAFLAETCH